MFEFVPFFERESFKDTRKMNDNKSLPPLPTKPPVRRCGFTHIEGIEPGARIVSMIAHKDTIFVATEQRMYQLVDDHFEPMTFIYEGDADDG